MEFLHNLPTIETGPKTNYRIKICVNFDGKPYHDTITNPYLLEKINQFIACDFKVRYAYFQKSNTSQEYGIIISNDGDHKTIYDKIKDDIELTVFGYQSKDEITYLTTNTRIRNQYYDFDWKVSINGFVQPNPYVGTLIHEIVDRMIIKDTDYMFYGLGGESGVYGYNGKFTESLCLTNSKSIYDDYKNNKKDNKICLIDYEKDQLNQHINNDDKKILLVNISRNGLKKLAHQITKLNFEQIIYIGCCDKAVSQDIEILQKRYKINEIKKLIQFPETEYYSYVICFINK